MSSKYVTTSFAEKVLTVTISRVDALNALNRSVMDELEDAFIQISVRPEIRAVILTGAGEKSFIAGADIGEMTGMTSDEALLFSQRGQSVLKLIEDARVPVIAAVNGFALGGGCEVAMACDIRIASTTAKFGLPEVSLGLIPGYGGTQRITRLVTLGDALYLLLSGEMISAEEAKRIGLIHQVSTPENLIKDATELAKKISSRGPSAVSFAKEVARKGLEYGFTAGCELEMQRFAELFGGAEPREGITAFFKKQTANFEDRND